MSIPERILLKISGESLMGDSNYGLNVSTANTAAVANVLATLIKALRDKGILA